MVAGGELLVEHGHRAGTRGQDMVTVTAPAPEQGAKAPLWVPGGQLAGEGNR